MLPLYPAQQLLRGIDSALSVTLPDADGEPKAGLTVTVTITDANGTVIATDAAATDAGSGVYTKAVTAAQLASLGWLTATWKVSSITRATTTHEIVGGFYASVAAIKEWDENVAATGASDETIRRVRGTVELAFEGMARVAFVPRYRRATLNGTGQGFIVLPDPMVRRIISVTYRTASAATRLLTADELATLEVGNDGVVRFLGSCSWFPVGHGNVVVEYEHGYDQPPYEIRDAAIAYLRERLQRPRTGIPDRAISFATVDGQGTYRLATPSGWKTGNPDIDAIIERHAWTEIGVA